MYTYDIPVPGPHIGSGKTLIKKLGKNTFTGKKGRSLQESKRGGPLSRMDRSNRQHDGHLKAHTHLLSVT